MSKNLKKPCQHFKVGQKIKIAGYKFKIGYIGSGGMFLETLPITFEEYCALMTEKDRPILEKEGA